MKWQRRKEKKAKKDALEIGDTGRWTIELKCSKWYAEVNNLGISNILSKSYLSDLSYKALRNGSVIAACMKPGIVNASILLV
ncbi:MAG TPA: hypothetical protein VGE97_10515 [Nitrososphaera sp.]